MAACSTSNLSVGVTGLSSNVVADLPAGPYFLSLYGDSYSIYKAYRLYEDFNFSFYYGIIDDQEGGFKALTATSPNSDGSATIAVPSRLYFPAPTSARPLEGVRVSTG